MLINKRKSIGIEVQQTKALMNKANTKTGYGSRFSVFEDDLGTNEGLTFDINKMEAESSMQMKIKDKKFKSNPLVQ